MKNSWSFDQKISDKYASIINYDKYGIDNPDKWNNSRLSYQDRINKIVDIVIKKFPEASSVIAGEFGCAQGNVSLMLAELGYKVLAIDVCSSFLEYSRLKYEKGSIRWVYGNIEDIKFDNRTLLDVAILGEVIEHCAYPEDIIKTILAYVKPNGLLVVTTPNGNRIINKLPTFKKVLSRDSRLKFKEKQFGPDGNDHLFLFTLDELDLIIPSNAKIIEKGYLGGTLAGKYLQGLFEILSIKLVEKFIRFLALIPLFNKKMINNIYMVVVKT